MMKLLSVLSVFLFTACASVNVPTEFSHSRPKKQIYKTVGGVSLSGQLYLPNRLGKKPAVVVVHGGSWQSKTGGMHQIADDLAGAGFIVFNIDYRLAPQSLYPKAVEDVRDAVRFLNDHADEYEIDRDQIYGWGYSAGSELILLVGLEPANHLRAIVAGGTPADFTAWPDSPIIPKFIGASIHERRDLWEAASPVNHVQKNSPPVFLYHGEKDTLVEPEQMEKMRKALLAQNVLVQTYTVRGWGHIGTYLFGEDAIQSGINFLKHGDRTQEK